MGKRLTTLSRKLIKIIERSNRIVVGTHIDPDCDGICSALIIARLIKYLKKRKPILFCQSPIPPKYNFLLKDYKFTNRISNFDLLIAVDSADIKRIFSEKEVFKINKKSIVVNIDHHQSNEQFGELSIIDENASSTCEILYKIFKKLKLKIDRSFAELFYSGIYNETGGFIYPNTNPDVLRIAAELITSGISPSQIVKKLNIKTLAGTLLLSDVLKTIKIKNGIGSMCLTRKMLKKCKTDIWESENFISFLQAIRDVRVSVFFREEKKGIRVSLRSDGIVDVNKFARKFGGGGHKLAAGIRLEGNLKTVKKKILKELKKIIKL